MARILAAVLLALVLVMFASPSARQGLRDLRTSWTHWRYPDVRDLRRSVALMPQKVSTRSPDSLTVPVTGWGDRLRDEDLQADREAATRGMVNPVAADDSSLARGERLYIRMCVPCHGKALAGDGPVAASFMPPPDLLGEATRARTDGFIFSYVRHGGVVMPRYGQSATAHDTWDLVNYIRHQQKVNPR